MPRTDRISSLAQIIILISRELELKSLSWWSWSWSWWSWSWYLSPEPELKSWSSSWSLSPEPEPKSTPIISRSRCHLREMSSWEARSTFLKFSETSLNDLLQVVSRLIKLPFAALCSSDWLCADRRWGEEYVSQFFWNVSKWPVADFPPNKMPPLIRKRLLQIFRTEPD